MKLKRFVAKDMRTALTLVKDELGDDAIIMSNKRVAAGIEIVAGVENLPVSKKGSAQEGASSQTPDVGSTNTQPASNARDLKDDRVEISSGGLGTLNRPHERRMIGGKNQAYAQSLIEILERQQAMSKEQGAKLMLDIAQQTTNSESKERTVEPVTRERTDPRKKVPVARLINSGASFDDREDDMANDPSKKAGPSTIDPSLDDDAELFKNPPLPLSQQREFKNFFVKSKDKQEKEAYVSQAGIDTYKGQPTLASSDPAVRQDLERMRAEVENIRKLLQFELAGLLQDNRSRNEPVKAMIVKLLHSVGFSDNVADELVRKLPNEISFNNAWREMVTILEKAILVGEDEIVSRGGIVTLIGPAGVGKTTTLAKLAARFVMRYGPQRVAIITADHYRIGAVEQIKTYGRIMGCATFAVKNLSELPQLLYNLSDKSLILVDTAGVGFKDERFGTQLSMLKLQSSLKLKHYLVLPCTAQRKVLQHAYDHFSIVGLAGLILTKIDECQNLGDALSLCIDMNLPISYVTDGQRVPEDLDVPHPNALARRALSSIEDDAAQQAVGNDF